MDSERTRKIDRSDDPLIGHLLDGRYEIQQLIARGGMATVYLASDTRLQRRVAVKIMHPAMAQDAEFVARFDREARSAAAIDHPGIVSVTDQGHDGPLVFLVMEYVAGRTLRQVLTERGRVSPADTFRVMEPLLDALGAAHAAGFVHRDIKPENILLADDGRVKITDFGLARAVEATPITTDANMLLGTVAYLAPEQVSRGIADARSDVYACGVLMYELLVGEAPHTANTPLAVAYKHVNDDVPPPSSVVPGVPPAVDAIVLAATSREPGQRPADGHELLGMLRQARPSLGSPAEFAANTTLLDLRDSPTTVTHVPRTARVRTPVEDEDVEEYATYGFFANLWWRIRRHVFGWIALLLVLALVAFGGWWLGSGRFATAPDLIGLTPAAATAAAQKDGLKVELDGAGVYSETIAQGLVAEQSPGSHKHLKHHGTITIELSRGPLRYDVPQVVGKTPDDARNALLANHMTLGSTTQAYSDTVPNGRVASTDPAVGTPVKDGTAVSIVVSKGPAPVDVPDVVGDTLDDATKALTGAGFMVATQHEFDDHAPRNQVTAQSASGQAPKGSTITLTVSDGPEMVEVPDLAGDSREQATATLQAIGLGIRIVNIDGSNDVIVAQSPKAHKKVRSGTTVTVYVT